MTLRKIPVEFSVEDIDRELIARGADIPDEKRFKFKDAEGTPGRDEIMEHIKTLYAEAPSRNPAFNDLSPGDLIKMLIKKTLQMNNKRGIWFGEDSRLDYYEIQEEPVKRNAGCVALICLSDNLIEDKKGFSTLKVKNYGKTFSLCDYEPFHDQPISKGISLTGFLVGKDTVATAAHKLSMGKIADFRFVFGFKMEGPYKPLIRVPDENIYKGVEVIHKVNRSRTGDGADWTLIKLDRSVEGIPLAKLSRKKIFSDQPVYVLGHPAGLPLKYASGARIEQVNGACFGAKLDIYCGNSGSPVFSKDTHEAVGMVVRGDTRDFRNTGECWLSVIYPNREIQSEGAECTRVSEFIELCQ